MRSSKLTLLALLLCLLSTSGKAVVVLSEIMFDPDGEESADEFVELYNNAAIPANLTGWMLSDGAGTDTLVDAGMGLLAIPWQYVLIIDPDYIEDGSMTYDGLVPDNALVVTITSGTFGSRGFSNSEPENVRLLDESGVIVSEFRYSVGNIEGYSEEKVRVSAGDGSENWMDGETLLGTPGFRNSVTPPERDLAILDVNVSEAFPVIGESFTLSATVVNTGLLAQGSNIRLSIDVSGGTAWSLSEESTISTIAPAESTEVSWHETLGESGMARYLIELTVSDDDSSNNSRAILVSSSVVTDGLVINEIQYDPVAGRAEWVELTVAGTSPVSLQGIRFSDGRGAEDSTKRHALPEEILLPGDYVIVATDSSIFLESIPIEALIYLIVDNAPTLNNVGDSLFLWSPVGVVLDRVDYRANWGDDINGRSLERISLTASSNAQENWGSCVEAIGSTPGRVNSRSQSAPRTTTSLDVSPSPFTPNNDGHEDVTEIRYKLEQPTGKIDLFVYDARGRQVRRLAGGLSGTTEGSTLWDGRDEDGDVLPTARYIVLLEAEKENGTVNRERATVILARPK